MNILYLGRGETETKGVRFVLRRIRQSLYFSDQDGFFEQSLHTFAKVSYFSFGDDVHTAQRSGMYDLLLVNWKQPQFRSEAERFAAIKQELDKSSLPKALFINAAEAGYLPSDEVLDAFSVIFKREPYRDRSRYAISEQNRAKIVPTMIHCPFAYAPKSNIWARLYHLIRPRVTLCQSSEAVVDVGFSGADAAGHTLRHDVWQRVLAEGFSTVGGLQSNPYTKVALPANLRAPRLTGQAYKDALCQAKVNLALDGIGEYTFRHQELLYVGAFILSSPSIREIELPMPLKEGEHYVAFDDLDDMVEKIRYYLTHETERLAIASAGRRIFNEYYDPQRHGQALLAALRQATTPLP